MSTNSHLIPDRGDWAERYRRTVQELDDIYREHEPKMAALLGAVVGVIYIRYSTKDQDSAGAQLRQLLQHALSVGVYVPRELIFLDLAVKGSQASRDGLEAASAALEQGKGKVLLVFTTSRLFRNLTRALLFVAKAQKEWQCRIIFVRNGLDTSDPKFSQLHFQILAMLDEHSAQMYRENVRAEHLQMLEDELICTTVAFGYGGEAVSGKLTKRGRPRRRWIIDLIACEYVVRIFRWFVDNGESIEEIVRRLNDIPGVPLPPKSKGKWSRTAVMRVLTNDVYLGILKYGDFESTDTPSKNYVVRKRRSAPLLVKHVERLRIMDDATWLAAQKILLSHPGRGGRKRKDGQPSPTSILQKLFYCPKHSFLYVGGAHGKYLYCRKCRQSPAKKRVLYTQLNCSTALSVTLRALAHSLKSDADLVNRIVEACTAAAKQSQTADPKLVDRLKARDKKVAAAITFAKENPGDSPEEQTETRQLLQRLRAQRLEIQSELAELAKAIKSARIPAESEVRDMIARLETVLLSAATSADRDQIRRCRQLVRLLTGGRITLQQCGEATPKAGWLEGTFQLQLLPTLLKELGQQRAESGTAPAVELSFRRVESFAGEAEEAFALFQQEWPECNIAGKLGCSRSRITKLLKYEYARRGLVKPDGRSRRKPSSNNPPRFQQIANDVKLKVEAGHSNRAIGRQLNVSDTTVEKAFRWWFESRGLKAPTVKERRESSIVRAIEMIEAGATLKATAAKLGYSPRGLKLRIADYLSEHNRPAIDFRSHWPGKGTMPPDTHGQIPDVA